MTRAPGRTRGLVSLFLVVLALLAAAASAPGAVVINEVESDGVADFVEVENTGAAPVDLGNYVVKDSDDGHVFTVPPGTTVPGGGYYVAGVESVFGLGAADAARLFAPGDLVTPIDSYAWTAHAAATYGRCPDGSGAITATLSATPSAANDCPAAALTWPGGAAVAVADAPNVFGSNLSGLTYQPSGSAARGVLWAVRNGPSTLYRLVYDGTKWTPDTANGWASGKTLRYPDGTGVPDAEGVTLAGGDANGVYVATERNDDGPNSNTSRPAVLRYDVSSPATTLNATRDFNLTGDLPGLGANTGLEAVTWVPDDLLVAKGFYDEAAGAPYSPARYPDHGAGLFVVGVEQDGRLIAYALNQATGAFTRVATVASGFPKVMGLEYDPETTHLWAVCDDGCDGRGATLDVGPAGRFVVGATYARPAGMANLNNEGFAIAPQAECVNGLKPVFWSDDGNTDGHALRSGTLACTVPPPAPGPPPVAGAPAPPMGPPAPVLAPPAPTPPADRTAPSLKVTLKLPAVRRTGKLAVTLTLGERANLTFTATARKTTKARARTLLKATRLGVAAGKRTLTLSLSHRIRAALRKGETVTLTVVARDLARNATTRRATAKVR